MEVGPYPKAPFPDDIPAHPLLVVDYLKIAAGDEAEVDTLFKACSTLGFFYLKVSPLVTPLRQPFLSRAVADAVYDGGRRTLGSRTWWSQCSRWGRTGLPYLWQSCSSTRWATPGARLGTRR